MIGRGAKWTVNRLVAHRIIDLDDVEIYQFGLESAMLKAAHYASMLLVGLILGMLPETILFLIVYAAIRAYAGGYHADTRGVCYLLSWITILSVLLIARFCPAGAVAVVTASLTLCAFPVIFRWAPVENSAKPLDDAECTHYRKRARRILVVISACALLAGLAFNSRFGLVAAECLGLEALMMLLGLWKNGR